MEEWPLSWSVIRHVTESGMAVLASDIRQDAQFAGAESIQRFRIRSILCVPLGTPVTGVVYLDNRSARPFTPADLPDGLDDEGRLVLVRRLIREGFLRRSAVGA